MIRLQKNSENVANILNNNFVNVPKAIHNKLAEREEIINNKNHKYFENTKRNVQNLMFSGVTHKEEFKMINKLPKWKQIFSLNLISSLTVKKNYAYVIALTQQNHFFIFVISFC